MKDTYKPGMFSGFFNIPGLFQGVMRIFLISSNGFINYLSATLQPYLG
jgi:hypothetical protein